MGHNLLAGKRGIIFGALDEKSIAWSALVSLFRQGQLPLATLQQAKKSLNVEIDKVDPSTL